MKVLNLKNKKFGKLSPMLIVSTSRNGHKRWLCKCDCGKQKEVLATHLVTNKIKSCGCLIIRNGKESPNFKGFGEISLDFWNSIKRGADGTKGRKKMLFEIDIRFCWNLFLKQKRKCALSGILLSMQKDNVTASLDRIDSSIGYTNENVQWVHKHINKMKNSFSQKYFVDMCRLVARK